MTDIKRDLPDEQVEEEVKLELTAEHNIRS